MRESKQKYKKPKGLDTNELTLFPALFQTYSNYPTVTALYFKIDFEVNNQIQTGISSLVLSANILPVQGTCYVDTYIGSSLATWFNIICINWVDVDGYIVNYEFMGREI